VLFPARHAEVGDVTVSTRSVVEASIGELVLATVAIREILHDDFYSLDTHLQPGEQAERVTRDVVRFLDHLFADRLLFWRSADEPRIGGWRECREAGQTEPLVTDDRTYAVYLWSGPLPQWRATTAILGRRSIRDERDYRILVMSLNETGERGLRDAERELARGMIADYERRRH
jgi:hypothetical protein